jgi:hypothetical protein
MTKKNFLVNLTIFITVFLSACSFSADFVIVNNSGAFVEVSYETKHKPTYKSIKPYLVSLENFNSGNKEWREVPEDRLKIDNEKPIVEVKVAPNEVLRFESVDAGRIKSDPYDELNTNRLTITGKNGSIILEGNQVFEQLEPQSSRWILFGPDTGTYAIHYK